MAFSNDANRAREDEWLAQLPTLPYPPTSALQQADTSVLGKMKHQGSNPPTYPHPQPGVGNQLPPIRNLVPGLWEPGTSKQILLDDCKNGPLIYPFRPLETNSREDKSTREFSRKVGESKKRPPSSPIERADHERTAPSNSVINSKGGAISNIQKPPQGSQQIGENPGVRPRSSSEAAKPTSERPGNGSQSSHQQEILRDPHSALRQLLTPRSMTINGLQRGRSNSVGKRVLRSGS